MPSQVLVGMDGATAPWDMALRPTGECWAVTHADAGLAGLGPRLQEVAPQRMGLEAPGSEQRAVVAALVAAGRPVAGVNPRHAHDVAKATGPLAQRRACWTRMGRCSIQPPGHRRGVVAHPSWPMGRGACSGAKAVCLRWHRELVGTHVLTLAPRETKPSRGGELPEDSASRARDG
jgi:hypothetical protein